jgi:hypothetical protein
VIENGSKDDQTTKASCKFPEPNGFRIIVRLLHAADTLENCRHYILWLVTGISLSLSGKSLQAAMNNAKVMCVSLTGGSTSSYPFCVPELLPTCSSMQKQLVVFFTMSPSRWLLFALALHAAVCGAMYSKRNRVNDFENNDGSRTRRRIEDMFLRNAMSGEDAQGFLRDGVRDGLPRPQELEHLASGNKKNISRNLRRRILKPHKKTWPAPYVASIRVWDRKKGIEVRKRLPILLPHEIVGTMLRENSLDTLTQQTWMDTTTSSHLEKSKSELGLATAQPILGLGLWMDGVPCNWDRTDSLEVFSLNLPGISRSHC